MQPGKCKYYLGPVALQFYNAPTGTWKNAAPVVNQEACKYCGQCVTFCPADIIQISPAPERKISIQYEYCKGCGICAKVCGAQCISMEKVGSQNEC